MKTFPFRVMARAFLCGAAMVSASAEKIRLEDLPGTLREKFRAHSGAGVIEDIDRQARAGKTTYQVSFQKNGRLTQLLLDEKGDLFNAPALPSAPLAPSAPATAPTAHAETYTSSSLRGSLVQPVFLASRRRTSLHQMPIPVQRTINFAAKGARLENLEQGIWHNQAVYQAAFKEGGNQVELQIRENGTILYDPRSNAARSVARGISGPLKSEYDQIQNPVPLTSSVKVHPALLPVAVQRSLATNINSRAEEIERGTWKGKTIYQVTFKDKNRKFTEIQIDGIGTVVFDPRVKR